MISWSLERHITCIVMHLNLCHGFCYEYILFTWWDLTNSTKKKNTTKCSALQYTCYKRQVRALVAPYTLASSTPVATCMTSAPISAHKSALELWRFVVLCITSVLSPRVQRKIITRGCYTGNYKCTCSKHYSSSVDKKWIQANYTDDRKLEMMKKASSGLWMEQLRWYTWSNFNTQVGWDRLLKMCGNNTEQLRSCVSSKIVFTSGWTSPLSWATRSCRTCAHHHF